MFNLKTKQDELDAGELKPVPIELKKLCSDKEVMKKAVHNRLNTKVNNLKKKIPDAFCLI